MYSNRDNVITLTLNTLTVITPTIITPTLNTSTMTDSLALLAIQMQYGTAHLT
jgi:hypothetical protein